MLSFNVVDGLRWATNFVPVPVDKPWSKKSDKPLKLINSLLSPMFVYKIYGISWHVPEIPTYPDNIKRRKIRSTNQTLTIQDNPENLYNKAIQSLDWWLVPTIRIPVYVWCVKTDLGHLVYGQYWLKSWTVHTSISNHSCVKEMTLLP